MISSRTLQNAGRVRARLHAANPKTIIFSGIQPTGVPHLGNYLGALRQWVKLQDDQPDARRFFSIVDLHAITVKQDPVELGRWRKEMFASLLAVGLDPSKSTVFYQSAVPAHSEFMWLLSCGASMGYLGRMTQWKSKLALPSDASPTAPSPSNKEALKLALFSYPVLQAADILLYNTTHVPVGEDQAQHLEFTRDLAIGFNHLYTSKYGPLLNVPETILSPAKRIMSLTEPSKKMSKSAPNPKSRILITDSRDDIHAKLKTAMTDSIEGVSYDRQARPGVSNLLDMMYYMDESVAPSPEELAKEMKDVSMRALKEKVADTIDDHLRDIRERYEEMMGTQQKELEAIARQGAGKATQSAALKMGRIRFAMGLR
ncbi:hypothetical protein IAQ61_011860 [Plenodomus lingam]|uniref:Tryptophan--tRNA ligase, mitochondrial n=1 Tax=Leptosphaeria maculans (strain JN3 / isolate v23.1.3 / race Av1-4-5-6-7-8) TaxID=985895 RepID=E5ABB5_LEPMJ|nr:similar to tryptophanyl-tRNA synthetase [Plenodomus lingam JN3]KAH9860076.1 hypothetical protein IAQ61_011860 [Plenodomus lingam]CBY00956.1 similar to tryptophanyl-tRNA synthetase [Plenodomus lingam JN3]